MRLGEKIIELLSKDSLAYSKPDNLFLFLANSTGRKVESVKAEFNKLLKKGNIFEVRKGKFISVPSRGYVRGKFIGNAKGFGFCQISRDMEDIFIPANKTLGAIDGDEVIVKAYSFDENAEGEVVSIFNPVKRVVGTVEKISRNFFLEPDNGKIPFKFALKKNGIAFKENDKVVANILRGLNKKMSAEVIEILGECNDVKTLELAIIREHNLYEEFPNEVVVASEKLPLKVLDKQKVGRVDLTKEKLFTIDGEDARDLDDAVSIKKTKTGYVLGVHIADVGEYVKKGSVIDEEAFKRGTSTYFPTSVLPMLPVRLSNGICSLNEGVERLALSCEMEINEQGKVVSHKIFESVIKSRARLTYTEAYAVICGEKTSEKANKLKKELLLMADLAKILEKNRFERGALDLDIPESKFVFDENGYVVDVEKRERNISHKLIEEFMVLANETVAKEFNIKGIPFVYRVHELPTKEKVKNVCDFMNGIGINTPEIPKKISPDFIEQLINLAKGKPYEETVSKVILRAMQKARYSKECLGHFGLALTYYCHFTSPIRRYPDLTIHRFIKESLHKRLSSTRLEEMKEFAFESAEQSSEMERNADKAERDVDDLWKAYLMKDRIGEIFEGVITGVNNFGFFVGLENSVEGLVKIESLPVDNYLFFEKSLMLKGQRFSFKIGDKVKVKLIASNIYTRKVDFECVF